MPKETYAVERRSERKQVQISVTLVIEGDDAEFAAKTVDFSPLGVRIESDAALAPGQPVRLLLGTDPGYFVQARVVWVGTADSPLASQAGFEFLSPLTGPVC
jgi:hypothetical protein